MTVTLRNLPSEIEKTIRDISRRDGISLSKATIRLLESSLTKKPARNTDFDEFFGTWSIQEAQEFDSALAGMRQIEPSDEVSD